MKIMICDDEGIFRRQLKQYLECYYRSLDVLIEEADSGEQLLENFSAGDFALIFLDIEMKKTDGIETAKKIRLVDTVTPIVFLTSHAECAPEGYEVDAFRFLLKPVNLQKLQKTLQDVELIWNSAKKLRIRDFDKDRYLMFQEIVYLEAQNVNVRIVMEKVEYLVRGPLGEYEKELNTPMFFKPHRSYLINLKYVVDCSNKEVTMENEDRIPISRNKGKELKDALKNYVRSF
jgi:DNA-binding LytR/AlgR family response regulator